MQATDELLISGSIAEIGEAIRRRAISVQEIADWHLARIFRFNKVGPTLNCVKDISARARENAATLDRELAAGTDRGPLHGIPVLVKDNVLIADEFTAAAGVKALGAFVPRTTATIVRRL